MRAEMIRLHDAAPMAVVHFRAFLARADAVFPVILVGKTTARPAEHGDVEVFQRGHDIVADAAGVGNRRVGPDPDALVDAASEVLGEVAVDVFVDDRAGCVGADGERRGRGCGVGGTRGGERSGGDKTARQGEQALGNFHRGSGEVNGRRCRGQRTPQLTVTGARAGSRASAGALRDPAGWPAAPRRDFESRRGPTARCRWWRCGDFRPPGSTRPAP